MGVSFPAGNAPIGWCSERSNSRASRPDLHRNPATTPQRLRQSHKFTRSPILICLGGTVALQSPLLQDFGWTYLFAFGGSDTITRSEVSQSLHACRRGQVAQIYIINLQNLQITCREHAIASLFASPLISASCGGTCTAKVLMCVAIWGGDVTEGRGEFALYNLPFNPSRTPFTSGFRHKNSVRSAYLDKGGARSAKYYREELPFFISQHSMQDLVFPKPTLL